MYRFIILNFIMFGWVHTAPNVDTFNTDGVSFEYLWNSLDYYYPDIETRQRAIDSRLYEPGAAVPFDVDLNTGKGLFITTPRIRPGIPATVGYLSRNSSTGSPPTIIPYPNLEKHTDRGNCDHIQNVYRIKIDECNRLWVMDTGMKDNVFYCPAKLLLFDLLNDQLISSYIFDDEIIFDNAQLVAPIVDIRNQECNNAFVYIADAGGYKIAVYDHKNRKSWTVRSQHFHQSPEFNPNYDVIGTRVDYFELTLGPVNVDGDRKLYFHELDSGHHGYVMTSLIRNSTHFENYPYIEFVDIVILPYERARSGTEVMNKDGILFYRSGYEEAVNCWTLEPHDNFNPDETDTVLKEHLGITTNLKIVNTVDRREILLITSVSFFSSMDELASPNELDMKIVGGFVSDFIHGKKCGPTL